MQEVSQIIIAVVYGLSTLLGIIGNGIIIFVVLFFPRMRNPTYIIIANLALTDLVYSIVKPFDAVAYVTNDYPFGDFFCRALGYVTSVCAYVTISMIVMLALDRLLVAQNNVRLRTAHKMVVVVVAVWFVCAVCNIPIPFIYKTTDVGYGDEGRIVCFNSKNGLTVFLIRLFCGYTLPLLVTGILYLITYIKLSRSHKDSLPCDTWSVRKETLMVGIVTLVYAICWLPVSVIVLLINFEYYEMYSNVAFPWIHLFSTYLTTLSSCVNIFVYYCFSERFRIRFVRILKRNLDDCDDSLEPQRID